MLLPFLIAAFVDYLQQIMVVPLSQAVVYAVSIVVLQLVQLVPTIHHNYLMAYVGIKLRAALTAIIINKVLCILH
jgi:hypothetical protein